MIHWKTREKLSAYLDQRLTQPERWELESHLQDCAECRKTLSEWKSLPSFLFSKPHFSEWNEDLFTRGVMARLDETPAKAWWKPALKWSMPLMGSALVAAWAWGAVLPNLPGLSSDSNLLDESGTQLASSASLVPISEASPSSNLTVSLISYDEGR